MNMNFVYKILLLSAIIVGVSYAKVVQTEHFTVPIRKWYRPHMRKLRIASEGFREKYSQKTTNFLRRMGII